MTMQKPFMYGFLQTITDFIGLTKPKKESGPKAGEPVVSTSTEIVVHSSVQPKPKYDNAELETLIAGFNSTNDIITYSQSYLESLTTNDAELLKKHEAHSIVFPSDIGGNFIAIIRTRVYTYPSAFKPNVQPIVAK